jgi:hypothetical protein
LEFKAVFVGEISPPKLKRRVHLSFVNRLGLMEKYAIKQSGFCKRGSVCFEKISGENYQKE